MKKLAPAFPIFVLLSLVIVTTTLEARRTPDWQREVEHYFASSQSERRMTILAEAKAAKPWNFDASMGRAVHSEAHSEQWPWGVDSLPYPPTTLHCVLAGRGPDAEANARLLFVGYHTDALWRVGWLVHEGTHRVSSQPFSTEVASQLDALSCDLDL